ncbi:hypothetical protein U1Q18_024020 [Sarracenia purpurea var. burkii]
MELEQIIATEWKRQATQEGLAGLKRKMENTVAALTRGNWNSFGHVQRRIQFTSRQLAKMQSQSQTQESAMEEHSLSKELDELIEGEEAMWKQSRGNWMTMVYRNTAFFHSNKRGICVNGLENKVSEWQICSSLNTLEICSNPLAKD